MKRCVLYILFLMWVALPGWAAETILLGNVYDAGTGEPIENASVFFRGSKIGTSTDKDGFFYLRLDVRERVKMTISAVGYRRQQFDIEPGVSAGMNVLLEERVMLLNEVEAMPGENPAIRLMGEVRARRHENAKLTQQELLPSDSRYFISDIQPRHLRKQVWQQMASGMLMQPDSTYLLPLPKDGVSGLAIPMPEHFDFYQSTIPLHTTAFLSPLAASAGTYYRFYLVDSLVVQYEGQREKHYLVHFLPKNTFDPLLQGVLEIDSATLALRHVEASAPRQVNINYLTALHYEADYQPSGKLTNEDLTALFEVALKTDTTHFFPSLLAERKSRPIAAMQADTLVQPDSAMAAFLKNHQPAPLVPDMPDSVVQQLQDSLMNQPLFRVVRWATETFYTGYIPTGTCIDIGKISDIIRYSPEEHLHLGLPFRTNGRLWQHVSLGAYVGYGFRDRGVKWQGDISVLLPTERRHLLRLTASDRYTNTDVSTFDALKYENSISGENMRFTTFLLNGIWYNKSTAQCTAARRREVQLCAEDDWTAGAGAKPAVETQLSAQVGLQGYSNPLNFLYYDQPAYRYASLRGLVRLSWHERRADFYTVRKYLYSHYPTLYIGGEMGSFHLDGEARFHTYGKLNLMLRQDVALGVGGTLSYLVEAGCVIGRVPYPLLATMNGNQSYAYQPERFTLMNYGQYAADRYVQMHVNWDGRGVLLGRIPGIRYLRLHELLEMKIAYGELSSRNAQLAAAMGLPNLQSLHVPYTEVGVGLGNILRIGEVYSVWRLTHRDDPSAALWAIRFRLRITL